MHAGAAVVPLMWAGGASLGQPGSCARRLAQQSQCRRLASVNRDRLLPRLATCDRYQSSSGRLAVLLYNTTRSSRGCLPQRPLVAEPFLLCVLPGLVQSCRNRGAIHGREHTVRQQRSAFEGREDRGATVQRLVDAGCRRGLRTRGS